MEIKTVRALYYSAIGGTKKAVLAVAEALAEALGAKLAVFDFTLPAAREEMRSFAPDDIAVVGTPVYAGRVPNKMLPYIQSKLQGNGALAVPVVTFGNRSFDSGLVELRNELEAHGFHTVAAAAVPAEHAFAPSLAHGRPDEADLAALRSFARAAASKAASLSSADLAPVHVRGDDTVGPYYTPLGLDGKPAVFLKAKPKTDEGRCVSCGLCAGVCPMGSISPENPALVAGICIKCQACVKKCPAGAKYFDDPAFLSHAAMLEKNYSRPAQAELFI